MHHVAKRILSSGYAVMHVYLEELRGLSLPTRTGWNEATAPVTARVAGE